MVKLSEIISYSVAEPYFEPAAKRLADELSSGASHGDTEWSMEIFMRDNNINVDTSDWDSELYKQWEEWLPEWASTLVGEAFEKISSETEQRGNMVKLYREIHASPDWFETGGLERPLGVYWSFDEHSAEAHWGSAKDTERSWVFSAWFPSRGIDWEWTLFQNAYPSYEDENEIRMQQGISGVINELAMGTTVFGGKWQIIQQARGKRVKT